MQKNTKLALPTLTAMGAFGCIALLLFIGSTADSTISAGFGTHDVASIVHTTSKLVSSNSAQPGTIHIATPTASATSQSSVADPSIMGQWSPTMTWPLIAVHMSLMADGRVLTWDATPDDFDSDPHKSSSSTTRTAIWDPATGMHTDVYPDTNSDIFCAGHAHLPDGRLFVAGGDIREQDPITATNIFDPFDDSWTGMENMSYARWYPSVAALPNGEMLVLGGTPDTPEVWNTQNNTYRVLRDATRGMPDDLYTWIQPAPNGKVLYFGPSKGDVRHLDTTGTGRFRGLRNFRDDWNRDYGSYAAYDTGYVMVSGGGPSLTNTLIIEMDTGEITTTMPMHFGRRQHNLTILADGTVLATGGNSTSVTNIDMNGGVYTAELWDPATKQWSLLADIPSNRQYHSTALLLPDATVLTAGGGYCDDCTEVGYHEQTAEIFSPPYLFKNDGSGTLALRPSINNSVGTIIYNQPFTIETASASTIKKVGLVRLGSVTHSTNMDQRYVPLTYTVSGANELTAFAPATKFIAQPGYYMLFIIDDEGVPSIAEIVNIPESTTNGAPNIYNWGNRFNNVGEVSTMRVTAPDPDGDGLTFGATNLPPALTIDPNTGDINGTFTTAGLYPNIMVSASDGQLTSTFTFRWTISEPPTPAPPTDTPTPEPTDTPTPIPPTDTSEPTDTPTPTPTPAPTDTPIPNTPVPNTPVPNTPTKTSPTNTPTANTPTAVPTDTPMATPLPAITLTITPDDATATPTDVPTSAPADTPTAQPATATSVPTVAATATLEPTVTPAALTPTPASSITPNASPTAVTSGQGNSGGQNGETDSFKILLPITQHQ